MTKQAVLSIWDGEKSVDLEVNWSKGYDTDATVLVPKRFERAWRVTVAELKQDAKDAGSLRPYPTLSVEVSAASLTKSASGFYLIAQEIWGDRAVGWRVAPPYPESSPRVTERQGVVA